MKNVHCMLSLAALLCGFGMFGASEGKRTVKIPPFSWLSSAGTISVEGLGSSNDYGVAVQTWKKDVFKTSGAIVVLAEGGMATLAAKGIAAQFPAQLEIDLETKPALRNVISRLNERYTSQLFTGYGDPYDMNVSRIAVMIVATYPPSVVSCGHASNELEEANTIPQVLLESFSADKAVEISLKKTSADQPVPVRLMPLLSWKPESNS